MSNTPYQGVSKILIFYIKILKIEKFLKQNRMKIHSKTHQIALFKNFYGGHASEPPRHSAPELLHNTFIHV